MKPLFYMLATKGPWEHHVRPRNSGALDDMLEWLIETGRVEGTDFEVLVSPIDSKKSRRPVGGGKVTGGIMVVMDTIVFFNDPKVATYVKMTWG